MPRNKADDDVSFDPDYSKSLNQLHGIQNIYRKFTTESPRFSPLEYFTKVGNELNDLITQDLFGLRGTPQVAGIAKSFNYKGAPARFKYNPKMHRKALAFNVQKKNDPSLYNNALASVKERRSYTNKATLSLYRKYTAVEFTCNRLIDTSQTDGHDGYDPLFIFKIYVPFTDEARLESIKIQREVQLKGSQNLGNLAESIPCHLDSCGLIDKSCEFGAPPVTPSQLSGANSRLYPDAFFFMDDKFYCKPIPKQTAVTAVKKFLEDNRGGPYEVVNWAQDLNKITWQVGKPFVYIHLGQCEHLLMLSDCRLRSHLPHEQLNFPMIMSMSNALPRGCMLCTKFYARWIVHDCEKLAVSEAFICHRCFTSYCYTASGEKICEFSAYEYIDPVAL